MPNLTPIGQIINPVSIVPMLGLPREELTIPLNQWKFAPDFIIDNSPMTASEFKDVTKFSRELIALLKSNQLCVKHIGLFFMVIQHCFNFDYLSAGRTGDIKQLILKITERDFLPNLTIGDNGFYQENEATRNNKIKLHWRHSQAIIRFEEYYLNVLEEELFQINYQNNRERYAQILDEGLQTYRIYIELQPAYYRNFVDTNDFMELNRVFRAHSALQHELNKMRSKKIWNI